MVWLSASQRWIRVNMDQVQIRYTAIRDANAWRWWVGSEAARCWWCYLATNYRGEFKSDYSILCKYILL